MSSAPQFKYSVPNSTLYMRNPKDAILCFSRGLYGLFYVRELPVGKSNKVPICHLERNAHGLDLDPLAIFWPDNQEYRVFCQRPLVHDHEVDVVHIRACALAQLNKELIALLRGLVLERRVRRSHGAVLFIFHVADFCLVHVRLFEAINDDEGAIEVSSVHLVLFDEAIDELTELSIMVEEVNRMRTLTEAGISAAQQIGDSRPGSSLDLWYSVFAMLGGQLCQTSHRIMLEGPYPGYT